MKNGFPYRIGFGYDVHRLVAERDLWICGIRIDYELGLLGHSDADVAIHALCDALLGAASLGDIGQHFPDNNPEFKGIDSKILLAEVCGLIRQQGYEVSNVDLTICAQAPKLAPFIPAMRQKIAEVMEIEYDRVSVKATTTEHLGFTGRKEGISAYAVTMIYHA